MNQPIPTPTPPLAVAVNDFYFPSKLLVVIGKPVHSLHNQSIGSKLNLYG